MRGYLPELRPKASVQSKREVLGRQSTCAGLGFHQALHCKAFWHPAGQCAVHLSISNQLTYHPQSFKDVFGKPAYISETLMLAGVFQYQSPIYNLRHLLQSRYPRYML